LGTYLFSNCRKSYRHLKIAFTCNEEVKVYAKIESTLHAAARALRVARSRLTSDDWLLSTLISRVEYAENQAGLVLHAASELNRANLVLRQDLDRLQARLGQARSALVGIATCEDPEQAREIAKAYVAAMEPEDVAETLEVVM
jgi:hypothetical protein